MTIKEEVVEILKKAKALHADWHGAGGLVSSTDGRCPLQVLTGTRVNYVSEARKMGYSPEAVEEVLAAADSTQETYRYLIEKILLK